MWQKIFTDGIWTKNQATVALLGLCPLLAVSNSVISALGLGIATLLVLTCSNTLISITRGFVPHETRIPIFVGIIASVVTITELILNAWWHDLYLKLGIFIPLIVTNCLILARAESYASKNKPLPALLDGIAMGIGFLLVLVLIGAIRELLGEGTLLQDAHLLFGEQAKDWTLHIANFRLLIAILPAGAFISLGLVIAFKQYIETFAQRPHISEKSQSSSINNTNSQPTL
jgi:electron transport complex protein RnfE